jgi:kumamolisin
MKKSITTLLAIAAIGTAATAVASAAALPKPIARTADLRGARDLGRLAPNAPIRFVVGLKLRNEAELDALLAAQATEGSPIYRHYLRPAQVRDAFGASAADYARVTRSLAAAGFRVLANDPFHASVTVTGAARDVERYFSTRLDAIAIPGTRGSYANVRPATAPAEIADVVAAVVGLSDKAQFQTAAQVAYAARQSATLRPQPPAAASTPGPSPSPTGTPGPVPFYGPDGGYGPAAVIDAYDFPTKHGYFGAGVTVADLIDGVLSDTLDVAPYLAEFGVTRTGPKTKQVNVAGGCLSYGCFDSYSETIDAESIIGTAPAIAYEVYDVPYLSDVYISEGLKAIVSNDVADVVNVSFAGCETSLGESSIVNDEYIKMGAAEGISFENVAFGGANPCGAVSGFSVQSPADSPHALAVGGADNTVTNGLRSSPPILNTGTGGGVSVLFDKPGYQDKVRTGPGRALPDIAGPAAINTVGPSVYYSEFGGWIGGFAFVNNAPVAGALAELAQLNGSRLGNVAGSFYKAYANTKGDFADVTLGCNGAGGVEPYCAGPGYDVVSGLGVPIFYNLAKK